MALDREERDGRDILIRGKLEQTARDLAAPLGATHGERELLMRLCNAMAALIEIQLLMMQR